MEYLPAVTLAERRAKVQREYLGHLVLLSDTKDVSLIDAPVKELQEFFEKNPSFISSSENISGSLLSRAYDMKAYEKIYLLLQKGANPDAIFEGSTLLHKAALQDDTFLVDILEKFGVNQNIRNHRGEIALNNAISNKSKRVYHLLTTGAADLSNITELGESMLHYAAMYDKRELVSRTLPSYPFLDSIRSRVKGYTALHLAVIHNHWEPAKELLRFGAQDAVLDNLGNLAVHYIRTKQFVDIFVEFNASLDRRNTRGHSLSNILADSDWDLSLYVEEESRKQFGYINDLPHPNRTRRTLEFEPLEAEPLEPGEDEGDNDSDQTEPLEDYDYEASSTTGSVDQFGDNDSDQTEPLEDDDYEVSSTTPLHQFSSDESVEYP